MGTSNEYEQIFKRIIIELQRCQDNYEEMLVLLLRHLLISFHRELTREHILKNEYLDHEMDNAVTFFRENYNQNINIDDYAASRGMSVSWFIRNFKKYTGSTPMQFIVGIRINNAQMLLETTTYSINEISKIVGYDNQLYFSRLFHKLKGIPKAEKQILKSTKRSRGCGLSKSAWGVCFCRCPFCFTQFVCYLVCATWKKIGLSWNIQNHDNP